MATWVSELDESGELPMHKAIRKLRDEITGVALRDYSGRSRELSLVMTKLDEAYQWAVAHGVARDALAIVDKAELLRTAATIAEHREVTSV